MTHYAGILDGSGSVWGIRIPDLPGVHGGGERPEAAILDAISAAREWAAHVVAKGKGIPAPRLLCEILREVGEGEAIVIIPVLSDTGRMVKASVTFDAGLPDFVEADAKQRGVT